jgi:hypothetical protein
MNIDKSRWQLLTSEVIATPGLSRALQRVGSMPWLGNGLLEQVLSPNR